MKWPQTKTAWSHTVTSVGAKPPAFFTSPDIFVSGLTAQEFWIYDSRLCYSTITWQLRVFLASWTPTPDVFFQIWMTLEREWRSEVPVKSGLEWHGSDEALIWHSDKAHTLYTHTHANKKRCQRWNQLTVRGVAMIDGRIVAGRSTGAGVFLQALDEWDFFSSLQPLKPTCAWTTQNGVSI